MAPRIVCALLATVLVTVVIAGLPDFNISNRGRRVVRSLPQGQLATLPNGYIAHPDIGTAYKIHNENVKWKQARERCISEGAHLAVIDTHRKLECLMNQATLRLIWIGIHSMYDRTGWVSGTTGSALTTLPWAQDEPSGLNDCVSASKSPRGLQNYLCISESPYVCELPIPGNYNGQGINEMAGTVIPGLPNFDITNTGRSVALQSSPQIQLATLPDGYVAHHDTGTAYKVYGENVSWMTAKARCISADARLAVIDTIQKLAYLMIQLRHNEVWVGIHGMFDQTEWVSSSTGLALTNLPWTTDEPDGFHDCVGASKSPRGLRHFDCMTEDPYVCELPIPQN